MLKFAKLAFCTLCYIVVFDIIGVVACTILDVLPLLFMNTGVFYAIWFVAGVFCAVLCFMRAGQILAPLREDGTPASPDDDWTHRRDAPRIAILVSLAMAVVIVALAVPCYIFQWAGTAEDSPYVPDSEPLSLTFFITILLTITGACVTLRNRAKKSN